MPSRTSFSAVASSSDRARPRSAFACATAAVVSRRDTAAARARVVGMAGLDLTGTALRPEDLLHGLALGELVDELVEIPDPLRGLVVDLFDANATDHARDQFR